MWKLLNGRTLNLFVPLADFLYIYQLEEYRTGIFLKWSLARIFKRNFQQVGTIEWTTKAKVLFVVTLILVLLYSFLVSFFFDNYFLVFVLAFILGIILIPFCISAASFFVWPLDNYLKSRILKKAQEKLKSMNKLKIFAVAGSVGKTSTRSYLFNILRENFKTFTPKGNYNTLLGIASEVSEKMGGDSRILILELGEFRKGDLLKLANFYRPSELILTQIGSQHLDKFGSQEEIHKEFLSLTTAEFIKKIYTIANNPILPKIKKKNIEVVKVADWSGFFESIANFHLPKVKSTFENLALASTIAFSLGISKKRLKDTIERLTPYEARLKIFNKNGINIIDDSYNISFESAVNALDYLKSLKGRKILVTGGIVEQGEKANEVNRIFAQKISKTADIAVVAKNNFYDLISTTIRENPDVEVVPSHNPRATPQILARILKPGDNVLVQNELPELYWH